MKILVIGSGGREHALAYKISRSPLCEALYCIPGNPGMQELAVCTDIPVHDHEKICDFCLREKINLVIVGPETPLVEGLADKLRARDIPVFGPSQNAAQLEGSKAFMKEIATESSVPTAFFKRFRDVDAALSYVREKGAPIVIKADGLAAGKGVVVAMDLTTAEQAVRDMLQDQKFGAASQEIIIEEFLEGEEISFFAICDGVTAIPFGSAQDHKRVGDGDTGPNTGGIGDYYHARLMKSELEEKIMAEIITPTLKKMAEKSAPFTGVLFAGLMIKDGFVRLLEFNVRFGDPECQTLMLRLQSDLVEILYAASQQKLSSLPKINWTPDPAICVVMAARGYPDKPQIGGEITLHPINNEHVKIFHAGTKKENEKLVAAGGRVLNICAVGKDIQQARSFAYDALQDIDFADGFFRSDIAYRAL